MHRIGSFFLTLLKLPIVFLNYLGKQSENTANAFKFSIRRRIGFHYILIAFFSFVLSIAILTSVWSLYVYSVYNAKGIEDSEYVYDIIETKEMKDAINKYEIENNIDISVKEALSVEESGMFDYFFKGILKRRVNYRRYVIVNNKDYVIYIRYDISIIIAKFIEYLIILFYGFGLLFFVLLICGSYRVKKILKPIYTMTKTANSISTTNLGLRLNVDNTKYELKDLAVTLNSMLDRIEKDYEKQKKFVSDVSHELRTPISVVKGYANMLDRWAKEDQEILEESIDAIKKESENMSDLVEKLLFLARFDNETLKYEMQQINLSDLMKEVVKDTLLIDNGTHIWDTEVEDDIVIYADYNRILQMIRIFIDNAIKYTKENMKIEIRLYKKERMAFIDIKDSGIGIAKDDIEKIFARFYRSDKSRTRATGGHGLGLSIAKLIAIKHGGVITVRSKVDVGSQFIIEIPMQNAVLN